MVEVQLLELKCNLGMCSLLWWTSIVVQNVCTIHYFKPLRGVHSGITLPNSKSQSTIGELGHYVVKLFHCIIHWIYCNKIGSLCSGPNSLCRIYDPFIVEFKIYVLDLICYILNLVSLKHLTIIKKIVCAIEKKDIYVFIFVAIKNDVSMSLIDLYQINVNPIWIFNHNITLMLANALVKIRIVKSSLKLNK